MKWAIEEGRKTRPNLEVGICGEHGGDPDSIEFCHMIGNNYVSCSPFRVPIARLAAAHAALKHREPVGVKAKVAKTSSKVQKKKTVVKSKTKVAKKKSK